jgi:5-methylcytosine-specific restriction endonuclease McrA
VSRSRGQARPNTYRQMKRRALCFYCGLPLVPSSPDGINHGQMRTRDHKDPLSRGGANHLRNLVWCCHDCNQSKGEMTLEEYREHVRLPCFPGEMPGYY